MPLPQENSIEVSEKSKLRVRVSCRVFLSTRDFVFEFMISQSFQPLHCDSENCRFEIGISMHMVMHVAACGCHAALLNFDSLVD